jgi:hypothetical protein
MHRIRVLSGNSQIAHKHFERHPWCNRSLERVEKATAG